MRRIGLTASEEMPFENVDKRRADGRTDDGYLHIIISSPMIFGSGELKIVCRNNTVDPRYLGTMIPRGRTGLVVRASDSGSGDPGSILGRVGVLFP